MGKKGKIERKGTILLFSLVAVLLFFSVISFVSLIKPVYAAHWVYGYVNNSPDGNYSSNGRNATAYCTEYKSSGNTSDTVGTTGNSQEDNWYMVDIEGLPCCPSSNCSGVNITVEVPDNGSEYIAGPVTLITTDTSDQAPNMTLARPPIIISVTANTTYASYNDSILMQTNGAWSMLNNHTLECYQDAPPSINKLCNSTWGPGERNCTFKFPWTDDNVMYKIYCVVCDQWYCSFTRTTTITSDNATPEINAISIISDKPSYLYVKNINITAKNATVYFNSNDSLGAGQNVNITVGFNESHPDGLIGNATFGHPQQENTTDSKILKINYTIPSLADNQSTLLTVYDKLNKTDNFTIYWIQSNHAPITYDNLNELCQGNSSENCWFTTDINVTLKVNTSGVGVNWTRYCIDDYYKPLPTKFSFFGISNYQYCNPDSGTQVDGVNTTNVTITCPNNSSCEKIIRYYSKDATGNIEYIIKTSNPIYIVKGSYVNNKTASFTNITGNSTVMNSINYQCNITSSIENHTQCEFSNMYYSSKDYVNISHSNNTHSSLYNSQEGYSNLFYCFVNKSTITYSNILNSTNYTHKNIIINSTIDRSNITNSQIYNSLVDPSTIVDSVIINSTITDDDIYYSRIENSTLCRNMYVYDASIKDNVLIDGMVKYGNYTYYGPFSIDNICANITPSPVGTLKIIPNITKNGTTTILQYHGNDVGYNVTANLTPIGRNEIINLKDDGVYPDETKDDAIYTSITNINKTTDETVNITATIDDNLGNIYYVNGTVVIDNTKPKATIMINNNDTETTSTNVVLYLNYSDENGVSYCRYKNNETGYNWTSWEYCTTQKEWTLAEGFGNRTVLYQVMDNAGNIYETSDDIMLKPNAPVIITPESNSYIHDIINVDVYSPDNTRKIEYYATNGTTNWALNGTIGVTIDEDGSDGWTQQWNTTAFSDGNYTLVIKAYAKNIFGVYVLIGNDTAENIDIDNHNPPPPTGLAIYDNPDHDGNITISWTAPTGSYSSDIVKYNIYRSITPDFNLTSGNLVKSVPVTKTSTTETLPDGTYYYKVTAVDEVNRESNPSNEADVVIDTKPPLGVLRATPSTVKNGDNIIFEYNGAETGLTATINYTELQRIDTTATANITLVDDGTGHDNVANDGVYTGNYTISLENKRKDGTYKITATVVDSNGNYFYPSTDITLDNLCTPPDTGDWIVNDTEICINKTIDLTGNLIIKDNSNLTFVNVILNMKSTSSSRKGIISNGTLNITDSLIKPSIDYSQYRSTDSIVRPSPYYSQYYFIINKGEFNLHNSKIDSCGWNNTKGEYGLEIYLDNSKITNNTFTNLNTIYIESNNNEITNNNITSATNNSYGIYIKANNNNIVGCNIKNFYTGIYINGQNNIIQSNTIENNNNTGIDIQNSNNNIIKNNIINNNTISGINLNNADNTKISDNIIANNTGGVNWQDAGIKDWSSSDNLTINDNTIYNNYNGIFSYGNHATIYNNLIYNNSQTGIRLHGYSTHKIYSNTLHNNHQGIWLENGVSNSEVYDNTINYSSDKGAYIAGSNNLIYNNIFNGTNFGIYLLGGNGYTVQNNTFHDNIIYGDTAGFKQYHGWNITIYNEEIYNGITYEGTSNSLLENSTIHNNTKYNAILFADYGNDISDNNTIKNVYIGNPSASYNYYISEGSNSGVYTNNYIINCSFNKSRVNVGQNATLWVGWYLDAHVKDKNNISIQGATIEARDKSNNTIFIQDTDSNGRIKTQQLWEYWQNSTTKNYFTNYNLHTTKPYYIPDYRLVNLTESMLIDITLQQYIQPGNMTPPIVVDDGNYTNKNTTFHAYWYNASDPESELLNIPLRYKIKLFENGTNITDWIDVGTSTEYTIENLTLKNNYNYTLTVMMITASNLTANASSDGIIVDTILPIVNVTSPSHPDQNAWYTNNTITFVWNGTDNISGIKGYSFMLDHDYGTLPDDVPETRPDIVIDEINPDNYYSIIRSNETINKTYAIFQQVNLSKVNYTFTENDTFILNIALAEQTEETADNMEFIVYAIDQEPTEYNETNNSVTNIVHINKDIKYTSNLKNAQKYNVELTLNKNVTNLYIVVAGVDTDNNRNNLTIIGNNVTYGNKTITKICEEGGTCQDVNADFAIDVKVKDRRENWTYIYKDVPEGEWWFHVKALDKAGNWGEQARYKVMITKGALAYIYYPISGSVLYKNITSVKGTTRQKANISLFVNGINVANTTSYGLFIFNNISLKNGTNEIYVNATTINTTNITTTKSNIVWVDVRSPLNLTFKMSYSEAPDQSTNHITYRDIGQAIVGLATERPGHSTGTGTEMEVNATPNDNTYIFITKDSPSGILNKENDLQLKQFLDLIQPLFGKVIPIKGAKGVVITLTYDDISISGNNKVGTGKHTMIIKNNGLTDDGRINITIKIR